MPKEIDIRATLVLATEDMIVEEGQYLIVIGKVCHGVFTGDINALPALLALPSAPAPKTAVPASRRLLTGPAPDAEKTPAKAERPKSHKKSVNLAGVPHFSEAQVLAAFKKVGKPVTAMKLGDRMGIDRADAATRQRLNYALTKLKHSGIVNYTDEKDAGFRKMVVAHAGPRGEAEGAVKSAADLFPAQEGDEAA